MHHQLREGLSFCFVGDRAIFLDLPGDRYFCLSPDLEDSFRAWAASGGADEHAGASLVRHGLLASGSARPVGACAARPETSLLERECSRPPPLLISAAFLHLVAAAAGLRFAGLAATIERFRLRKARVLAAAPDERLASDVAQAYEATALLTSSHDKCLWRSIGIARHLASLGLAPDLVLGVRLRPFHAHCWVQLGETVANDRVENVRTFTPILAI